MFGAPGSNSSRKKQSGTTEYPTAKQLFSYMVSELLETDIWSWLHFEARQSKGWAEIALDSDDLLVNFLFPFRDSLENVFSNKEVEIPESWALDYFKKKKAATFRVNKVQADGVINFLDNLFIKVYECPIDYVVTGEFSR